MLNNLVKQIQDLLKRLQDSLNSFWGFKRSYEGNDKRSNIIEEREDESLDSHKISDEGRFVKRDDTIEVSSTSFILDSGTTYSYLPDALNKQIALGLDPNATLQDSGMYAVNCDLKVDGNYLTFKFQSKEISMPLTRLIVLTGLTCSLGFVSGSTPILGDNFLRSCYTLFNLDSKTISIAQINYTDDEDIQVIS